MISLGILYTSMKHLVQKKKKKKRKKDGTEIVQMVIKILMFSTFCMSTMYQYVLD